MFARYRKKEQDVPAKPGDGHTGHRTTQGVPTPGFTIIGKKSRLRYFLGLAPLAYVSLLTNAVAVVTALANCLPHSAAAGRSRPPPAVPMAPKLLGDHVALVRSLACSDNNQGTLKMKATRQSTQEQIKEHRNKQGCSDKIQHNI